MADEAADGSGDALRPRHLVLSFGQPLERTEDGDSPRPELDPLENAPEHASQVARAFTGLGYTVVEVTAPGRNFAALVEAALESAHADVLVVHFAGHGELARHGSGQLYLLDGAGRPMKPPVSRWIELIEDDRPDHRPMTLFILDVCHAGQPAVLSWHGQMDPAARRAWVLAATGPTDRAYDFRLSRALVSVLAKYRSGEIRFDPSVRYIPAPAVWREIGHAVDGLWQRADGLEQRIGTSLVPSHADLSHLPFFPNPAYREDGNPVAGLPPEIARLTDWAGMDPGHFMRRAGGAEPVGRGWEKGYFAGREEELGELTPWLDGTTPAPGLRVVTGKPGAGKSALLGILVCAAHPLLREHTELLWRALGERAPGRNERIAVVHARRLAREQIVDSLARQLRHIRGPADPPRVSGGHPAEPDAEPPDPIKEPADFLLHLLPADGPPVTVIVDALDEAILPEDLTTTVLIPLAQHARTPGNRLRLLVGTRDDPRFRALIDLAQAHNGCTDLSTTGPATLRSALGTYVSRLLTTDGSPYADASRRPARNALAGAIAGQLTDHDDQDPHERRDALQWGEFLTAGLYVHYLLTTEEARDTVEEAADLGRAVPRTLPAFLDLDLRRHRARPLLRPVLTALAFAQGRGMPESVLAEAAVAFTASGDEGPVPWKELQELLDGEARFYLRREVDDDGTTLYRLFHEGLADWMRDDPAGAHPATDGAGRTTTGASLRVALYERLMGCVDRDDEGRPQWERALPYLLRHIARHAVDAGRVDALIEDIGFLIHADPHGLAEAMTLTRSDQAQLNAAVYRASWGVHRDLPAGARRQLLALDAARFGHRRLRAELPGDPDWRVRWATGSQVSPSLVRVLPRLGEPGYGLSMAVVELDGRPHVITVGFLQPAEVWDLTTGVLIRTVPLTGLTRAMAVAELDGRPVLLVDGRHGQVQVWDIATGARVRTLTGHTADVTAVTVGQLKGRAYAITSAEDGQVRVWKPATGKPAHAPARLAEEGWSVAAGRYNRDMVHPRAKKLVVLSGRLYAIVEGVAGWGAYARVRQWDPVTDTWTIPMGRFDGLTDVVAVAEAFGRPHAFTARRNGQVDVWDLTTGGCVRTLTGHTEEVSTAVVAQVHGGPHVFTGSHDGQVRVWDLATGECVHTLTGHTENVPVVAVTELNGRPHVLGAGWDGQVRVWDLARSVPRQALAGHTGAVTAVAVVELDGRSYAVTGGGDGDRSVRLWDLATGECVRTLTGLRREVYTITVAELDGRPIVVVGTGQDEVKLWDPATGDVVRTIRTGRRFQMPAALAVLHGDPHVITTTIDMDGDGVVEAWALATGARRGYAANGHYQVYRTYAIAVASLGGRPHAIDCGAFGDVLIWDLSPEKLVQRRVLAGHTGAVYTVAVTELEGRPYAVTGSEDGTARLWDLNTGTCLRTLVGHNGAVRAVAVAELEGRPYAVTGSEDGTARLWDLNTGTCLSTFHLPSTCSAVAVTRDGTVVLGVVNEVVVLDVTTPLKGRIR
ncbi:caspase family protein [Streptomyces sp. NPDC096339]|uniref:caspase family protein n=1 Tax=Streptomyces sp. NPDC096339 TaxID=3366086 RepID=UPI0037FB2AFF